VPVPKKKKAKKLPVVAPKGPPVNQRPAGAHKSEDEKPRAAIERAAIDEQLREREE
jgi:hypothetical protein